MKRIYLVLLTAFAGLLLTGCDMQVVVRFIEFTPEPLIEASATPLPPTRTPRPTAVRTRTARPTSIPTPTVTPTAVVIVCTSPLEPGVWSGSVNLTSNASRSGFRIINQDAEMPVTLRVSCDGSITGEATRTGSSTINVPFTVNGACQDTAVFNVTGKAEGGAQQPKLNLRMTAREGELSCQVNSRTSQVPSGDDSTNLTGYTQRISVSPTRVSTTRIEGDTWPDSLYQDIVEGLEDLVEEARLTTQSEAAWALEYQGP